jgi:hypothetical protein
MTNTESGGVYEPNPGSSAAADVGELINAMTRAAEPKPEETVAEPTGFKTVKSVLAACQPDVVEVHTPEERLAVLSGIAAYLSKATLSPKSVAEVAAASQTLQTGFRPPPPQPMAVALRNAWVELAAALLSASQKG